MVAKITTPLSINRALNYNEQKVQKGKAECLFAGNFLQHASELNFYQKLARFQELIEQNGSKTNTLHISLNFHPSETISKESLIEIAGCYMNKIGFGEQPFLVYQHFDAGHPHLHIVTTNIQANGKRIDTYNIGRNQSQKARKEIELSYGLVRADGGQNEKKATIEAEKIQRVKYGLAETKRSITNVLNVVLNQYKFSSLAELNAVLKLYNIIADRGSEESRTYKNRGLHYRLLDENGNKIGVPIKASCIFFKPTLSYLEEKFQQNEALRIPHKSKLKTAIDWTLSKKPESLQEFISELQKEKVTALIQQNDQGFNYGVTFIDHRTKVVFKGSDLGKQYSALGLKERISNGINEVQNSLPRLLEKSTDGTMLLQKHSMQSGQDKSEKQSLEKEQQRPSSKNNLLELLTNKEQNDARIPIDLTKKKKKRRKPKF